MMEATPQLIILLPRCVKLAAEANYNTQSFRKLSVGAYNRLSILSHPTLLFLLGSKPETNS